MSQRLTDKLERELNEEIRLRLTRWRHERGARCQLAATLGTPNSTLRHWEKGDRSINLLTLLAWHRAGHLDKQELCYLLCGEDDHS